MIIDAKILKTLENWLKPCTKKKKSMVIRLELSQECKDDLSLEICE